MTVACLGEALIDLVPPHGESPQTATTLAIQPGGAPLNIAVGLSRLAAPSLLLGRLSDDAFGQRLAAILAAEGVSHHPRQPVANPTRLAVVDHLNSSSPFRFYGDVTADTTLSLKVVEEVLMQSETDGLYVSSMMMTDAASGEIQRAAMFLAEERKIPIYSDPNPRPSAWHSQAAMVEATEFLLRHSTIAKLSIDDAIALGWPSEPGALLAWCRGRFEAQIFVTGGSRGSWTLRGDELLFAEAPIVKAIDPTGAGDASFAALIYRHRTSGVIDHSELSFAVAAGALATQKRGAMSGLPSLKEITEMLDRSR